MLSEDDYIGGHYVEKREGQERSFMMPLNEFLIKAMKRNTVKRLSLIVMTS